MLFSGCVTTKALFLPVFVSVILTPLEALASAAGVPAAESLAPRKNNNRPGSKRITTTQATEVRHGQPSQSPYGADVVSLAVVGNTIIRQSPYAKAPQIGELGKGTRVSWRSIAVNNDCATHWVEIKPRGWICAEVLPSKKSRTRALLPPVEKGKVVPGNYGRVARRTRIYPDEQSARNRVRGRWKYGSMMVRQASSKEINGELFWQTQAGEWIAASNIIPLEPSEFQGVWFNEMEHPDKAIGFSLAKRKGHTTLVMVRDQPSAKGVVVSALAPRTPISVLKRVPGFVMIGENQWVARQDLRIMRSSKVPRGVAPNERWIDIDIRGQIAVAYQGDTPVFATLVSTGTWEHPTPRGTYRILRKMPKKTMRSLADAENVYNVADVPWAMFFRHGGYALHTAYWHGKFGYRKSHGCINMAPKDAKAMYKFLGPKAQPGWAVTYGDDSHLGAVVRIR